jgi:hypothetical protein
VGFARERCIVESLVFSLSVTLEPAPLHQRLYAVHFLMPGTVLQVYDGVMKGVSEQSPLKQRIFHRALAVSRLRNTCLEFGRPVSAWLAYKHRWADKIVLSKIREKLGGRLK